MIRLTKKLTLVLSCIIINYLAASHLELLKYSKVLQDLEEGAHSQDENDQINERFIRRFLESVHIKPDSIDDLNAILKTKNRDECNDYLNQIPNYRILNLIEAVDYLNVEKEPWLKLDHLLEFAIVNRKKTYIFDQLPINIQEQFKEQEKDLFLGSDYLFKEKLSLWIPKNKDNKELTGALFIPKTDSFSIFVAYYDYDFKSQLPLYIITYDDNYTRTRQSPYSRVVRVLDDNLLALGDYGSTLYHILTDKLTSIAIGSLKDMSIRLLITHQKQLSANATARSPINCINFSKDNEYCVSASDDKTAAIWSIGTGQRIYTLRHEEKVNLANFSNNGNYVVTVTDDKIARIWDFNTGQCISTLNEPANHAAFSNDDEYLVILNDKVANVLDASTNQCKYRLKHNGKINSVEFSHDNRYVITASSDKSVKIWDLNTGNEIHDLRHDKAVKSATYFNDKFVVTVSHNQRINLWDLSTNKCVQNLETQGDISCSKNRKNLLTVYKNRPLLWTLEKIEP